MILNFHVINDLPQKPNPDIRAFKKWNDWLQRWKKDPPSPLLLQYYKKPFDIEYRREMIDFWKTPNQTVTDGYGDCEDFALLKYSMLRDSGIYKECLRVGIVFDHFKKEHHAILLRLIDGEWIILDNQLEGAVLANNIKHYEPRYHINEQGGWFL